MRTFKVDIDGLDLVLGGGIRLLERVKGCGESTTILIRGPAGSGKTVLGSHLASGIARALNTDVAYGCIELLPTELRAQYESVRGEEARDQVVILREEETEPDGSHARIYAGLLDLGEGQENVERFGGALGALLSAANERAKRNVRVLVIDSLSKGYSLGSDAPRILADGVSKLAAEKGLVVILLEEQFDDRPSMWSFAVDMVLELQPAHEQVASFPERRLLVSKNRLGPSDPGPHEFTIMSGQGVIIAARELAYQRPWTYDVLRGEQPLAEIEQPWHPREFQRLTWLPPFRRSTVAVVGRNPATTKSLAFRIGNNESRQELADVLGGEVEFGIGISASLRSPTRKGADVGSEARDQRIAWSPLYGGAWSLKSLRSIIDDQRALGRSLRRVIIGDLSNMRHYATTDRMMLTITIMASMLRDLEIPLILYETVEKPDSGAAASVNANIKISHLAPHEGMTRVMVENLWGPPRSEIVSIR